MKSSMFGLGLKIATLTGYCVIHMELFSTTDKNKNRTIFVQTQPWIKARICKDL